MKRISYTESERMCESAFAGESRWWHLYTPGNLTSLLFVGDADYRFAMNLMARCLAKFTSLKVIAFEIMSNHLHIVLSGDESLIRHFFDILRRRLQRYLSAKAQGGISPDFRLTIKQINDLKTLRNTIVYVNRNGYVVNPDHTPFSYPWGTGRYYFSDIPATGKLSEISDSGIREMFRSRNPRLLEDYRIIDGYVMPTEYCDIKLGMSMFRDAHQYYYMVSKNVEAYGELASELDDSEFLTDSELFTQVCKLLNSNYGNALVKDLSQAQKMDLARRLRSDYRSSNGQIRRVLGLSQYEVDSLFPLSKR